MSVAQFGASGNYGTEGVGIAFFSASIRTLQKLHGRKMTGPLFEDFRAYLAAAETVFCKLTPAAPATRKTAGEAAGEGE